MTTPYAGPATGCYWWPLSSNYPSPSENTSFYASFALFFVIYPSLASTPSKEQAPRLRHPNTQTTISAHMPRCSHTTIIIILVHAIFVLTLTETRPIRHGLGICETDSTIVCMLTSMRHAQPAHCTASPHLTTIFTTAKSSYDAEPLRANMRPTARLSYPSRFMFAPSDHSQNTHFHLQVTPPALFCRACGRFSLPCCLLLDGDRCGTILTWMAGIMIRHLSAINGTFGHFEAFNKGLSRRLRSMNTGVDGR